MLKRPTELQCYDIIKWSVQYLQDYGMHENALFRESKSQHDIRSLKAQICEGRSRRQLGDLDCHVVGGVLVSALKDMPNALLFEIQENLQEAADLTDGTDECLDRIAAYLSLLPPLKIDVVRVLFTYLHNLAASPANDANVVHLMIIFAPLFCRPDQTAHMSIRHVDMLRQLRPLLQMTLDSNHYIMRHIVATPSPAPALVVDRVAAAKDSPLSGRDHRMAKGGNSNMHLSINIGGGSSSGSGNKTVGGGGGDIGYSHSERKVSSLSIPHLDIASSTNSLGGVHSHSHNLNHGGAENISSDTPLRLNLGTSMDVDPYPPPTSPQAQAQAQGFFNSASAPSINTHSWEWKLLDSLVLSRVETLLHKSDLVSVWDSSQRKSSRTDSRSSSSSSSSSARGAPSPSLNNNIDNDNDGVYDDTEMEQDEDDVIPVSQMQNFHDQRLNDRRALIAECKQLRQEIQHFEERWIVENKRSPKPHERGSMQHSYSRYKDIKKAIRDNAATDIQRLLRGHFSRLHSQPPYPSPSSPSSGPMELDQQQQQQQQQQDYIQQSQFSHLQKRPASADGYHSPHNNSSPLGKALAGAGSGAGGSVSMSTSLPLTRSVSDEGPAGIPGLSSAAHKEDDGSHPGLMLQADSKSSPSLSHASGMKLPQQNAWLSHDEDSSSSGHHAMSKSQGGGSSGSKQSGHISSSGGRGGGGGKYSDDVNILCTKYQDALDSKKQLKKMLKKFDDDFVLKKGRAPKKADKEVMRPQYQKYHEVRGDLEKLKTEIVKTLGHFPKELEESKATSAGGDEDSGGGGGGGDRNMLEYSGVQVLGHGQGQRERETGGGVGRAGGRGEEASHHMEEVEGGDDDDDHISGTSISSHEGHHSQQGHNHSQGHGSSGGEGAKGTGAGGGSNTLGGLDELNQEKKQLHLYLKAFEKEFNRSNGRHVMHPEDILPVAKEYQRYKELKKILKDFRASSSSSSSSSTTTASASGVSNMSS